MATTVSLEKLSTELWELTLHSPIIADMYRAGQFVHVRTTDSFQPFLRRPLSIGPPPVGTSGDDGVLRLIFAVRGEGTRLLTEKREGDVIDLVGPLGKPFDIPADITNTTVILIAGGIGIVPLMTLDEELPKAVNRKFLLGVRSDSYLSVSRAEIVHRKIQLSSDDGSIGFHGNVVGLLKEQLRDIDGSVAVYACGPGVMMSALKEFCTKRNIPLHVSLEVSMGCGVGACQSCAVPKADGSGYYLVCADGPVFDADSVELNPETLP